MVKKTKGSGKRFGVRYGKVIRDKVSAIEAKQRKKYKCPSCNALKLKRVFAGVWYCKKCDTKFAGRAYSFKE